ncbi:hypothetical protein AGMMS50230_17570 [Spirochaetia bacterium]|nr:hypothetical protein AGMMS50230_17570 [Spirochaetia bacterium]
MYLHHYAHDGYGSNELNANYFAFTQDNDEKLGTFSKNYRVKVRRKDNWGYHSQGYVQLVIFFGRNTIVNGNRDGILFHEPGTAAAVRNNSVFVLHFNVFPKKPYPWES